MQCTIEACINEDGDFPIDLVKFSSDRKEEIKEPDDASLLLSKINNFKDIGPENKELSNFEQTIAINKESKIYDTIDGNEKDDKPDRVSSEEEESILELLIVILNVVPSALSHRSTSAESS